MAYVRTIANGTNLPLAATSPHLGHLGWDTQFLPFAIREGHEVITRDAIPPDRTIRFTVGGAPRSRTLSADDIRIIIRGNQDADIQYLRRARSLVIPAIISRAARAAVMANATRYAIASFSPGEQKHHALRRTHGQSQADARGDVVSDLRSQHAGILTETDWNKRLYRIGKAIHLIQDAFSPAHMERDLASRGCIRRIRNYGGGSKLFDPGTPGPEHGVPTDHRDRVSNHPGLKIAAANATRRYLQIVFKAIYGRDPRNPDAALAVREAAEELNNFITDHFRPC
ncbi:MAG: hypothetical protein HY694_18590 [Deltaproteobacteria bacterium]|nr:hypothetical protein [Deltaproteobacteria bacterium]